MIDRFNLDGQVVLVTGGTSRYGRPLVRDIAACGGTVITTSRDIESAEKIAEEEQQQGRDVNAAQLELGNSDSISDLCRFVEKKYSQIDGLVNNAVSRPMSHLYDDIETWDASMSRNATGTFELTRWAASQMSEFNGGSIVNIGSIYGMVGPNKHLYEGTKLNSEYEHQSSPDYYFHNAGMINLSKYFASEFGSQDIRVNCVSPGGFFEEDLDSRFVEKYEQQTMLGRMATGEDLSGVVVFLLSDAARYVTGTNIPVDGGFTSK